MKSKRKNDSYSRRRRLLVYSLKVAAAVVVLSTIIIMLVLNFVIVPNAACQLDKMPPELRDYNRHFNTACKNLTSSSIR